MIKLPARQDGQWTVRQSSDKLPDLSATRNLTFDKEGYIRLSKPTASFYSSNDDADFQLPLFFGKASRGVYAIATEDAVFNYFSVDYGGTQYDGTHTVTQDAVTDTPIGNSSYRSGTTFFDDNLVYVNTSDRKCYTNSLGALGVNAWTVNDTSASLDSFNNYPACNFLNQTKLAVGHDNQVITFTTSYAASTELTLPDDFRVTNIAYNNGYVGITTQHKNNQRALFAVWDGNTTEANYIAEVPSDICFKVVAYGGTFAFLTGIGTMYYWTPNNLTPLFQLPLYYTDGELGQNKVPNNTVVVDGELIHIQFKPTLQGAVDQDDNYYLPNQPGGIWTYDPAVGLYHRHAPSGRKIIWETIATTAVNTSTDVITVTTAPDTGTPVVYTDSSGTAIGGLTSGTWYYTIKVSGTTIKLAESYSDAIAGTQIDLTGTGNNDQTLQFYEKADFGQSYIGGDPGAIHIETQKNVQGNKLHLYYQRFFYGFNCAIDSTTEYDLAGFAVEATENRGYFITSKFMSSQLQEDWQKLFIKHKDLVSDLDKIVIKYRTLDEKPLTKITAPTDGVITWTDSDTFTTTDTQWANVQAGDEVEFIQGTGSGYLAHVTSISESSGTYTVNIDETIKNLTASDTGRAIASRWQKLTTLDNGIISNEDGYSEITVGVKSKQIQFKIELRGEDVEIEEILIAHNLHKPVA